MGKRQLHVIAVPKGVTIALLVLVSAAMLLLFYVLSRHAYVRPAGSTADLFERLLASERAGKLTTASFIATLWPIAANVALFVPWGFLTFIALDRPQRSRAATYAITIIGGIVFAMAIQVWDWFMPMRVTTTSDAFANGAGALCGAILGHLRKQVRIRFDY